MSRRLPPLNALRAFEAAARHLSFTRAAEELNVTQAAISHQMKTLEDHLGVPLFRRLNRALLLTDAGQTLFPVVRDALDQLTEATAQLTASETGGALTVSTLPSFAVKWLVPRMSHFLDRYRDIDLRISAKEYLADFARDGIDVAIRFGGGSWAGVRSEWIADEALTPVCSRSLASRLQTPADLARVTLLHEEMLPLASFPVWKDWLAAAGVSGVDASRGPRFSHTHLMLQSAMDGRGVALGQTVLAGDDLRSGRLVAPFDLRLPTGFGYYICCPPTASNRPKIQAFREWVLDEMGEAAARSSADQAAVSSIPVTTAADGSTARQQAGRKS